MVRAGWFLRGGTHQLMNSHEDQGEPSLVTVIPAFAEFASPQRAQKRKPQDLLLRFSHFRALFGATHFHAPSGPFAFSSVDAALDVAGGFEAGICARCTAIAERSPKAQLKTIPCRSPWPIRAACHRG